MFTTLYILNRDMILYCVPSDTKAVLEYKGDACGGTGGTRIYFSCGNTVGGPQVLPSNKSVSFF